MPRDFHSRRPEEDVDHRRSGFFLAGLLVLVYLILLVRGASHPLLLAAALLMAAGAWFEVWFVRRTVDALIGAGTVLQRFTNPLLFGLIYILAVLPTAAVLRAVGKDVLINGNEKLRLEFDCRACEMHVMGRIRPSIRNAPPPGQH